MNNEDPGKILAEKKTASNFAYIQIRVFKFLCTVITLLSISDWGKPQDFFSYDIAIIIIEKAFKKKFNGKSVRPLCLQGGKGTNWDIPPLNADITIIGMGHTGDHP